jgi:protein ImuB
MYACVHALRGDLAALASSFSPVVEQTSADTVVFSIEGLERLIGTPHQIASEIARTGSEMDIPGRLAIAYDPDTAVIAARNKSGVTVIPSGKEMDALANLPVEVLDTDPAILETLESWGIYTLAELAELPEEGLAARFGEEGIRLQRLASGRLQRALRVMDPPLKFARRVELDHPILLLEPLLFVLSSILHELTEAMRRQAVAANRTELVLELSGKTEHCRTLELASTCCDPKMLLKLLQLDLEAHPPGKEILAVRIELHPTPPQALQHGLFLPASPEPQKLQLIASRLKGLVGEGNVGSPVLLDTYRPDAFAIRPFRPSVVQRQLAPANQLHMAFRAFRPAPAAEVRLKHQKPTEVKAYGVQGAVRTAAGPWHSSGDWWTESRWTREEWDVDLSDGGLYRIYCCLDSQSWFVGGFYD